MAPPSARIPAQPAAPLPFACAPVRRPTPITHPAVQVQHVMMTLLRIADQRVREALKQADLDEDDELTFEDRSRMRVVALGVGITHMSRVLSQLSPVPAMPPR